MVQEMKKSPAFLEETNEAVIPTRKTAGTVVLTAACHRTLTASMAWAAYDQAIGTRAPDRALEYLDADCDCGGAHYYA